MKSLRALCNRLHGAISIGAAEETIDEMLDGLPRELRELFRLGEAHQRARELRAITRHSAWRREKII